MSFQGHPWAWDPISKFFFPLHQGLAQPGLCRCWVELQHPAVDAGCWLRHTLAAASVPYRIHGYGCQSSPSRSKFRFVCLGQRAAHSRGKRLTCIDCLNQSSMNPIDESTGGSFFGNRLRRKAWWRIRLTAPCSRAWLTSVAYKMTAASAVDRPCWRCGPDDPVARRRASSGPAPFWTA